MDAADPAIVYALTRRGLSRSLDGGESWRSVGEGFFASTDVNTLLSDPRRPATLYAGIDGGVLKSLDRGETWRRVGPEGFTASVYSVALAGSRLLAGTTSGAYELSEFCGDRLLPIGRQISIGRGIRGDLAVDASGAFLAVYSSPGGNIVWTQAFDDRGARLGPRRRGDVNGGQHPQASSDAAGRALTAWQSIAGGTTAVLGRAFDVGGAARGGPFRIDREPLRTGWRRPLGRRRGDRRETIPAALRRLEGRPKVTADTPPTVRDRTGVAAERASKAREGRDTCRPCPDPVGHRAQSLLSHGVKESLVDRPSQWPGVHSVDALLNGTPLVGHWYDRAREFAARQLRREKDVDPEQFKTQVTLEIEPLPCWIDRYTEEEIRGVVAELVKEIEEEGALARRKTGKRSLGVKKILRMRPHHRPRIVEKSPKPRFHAVSREAFELLREAYRAVIGAYREASERLLAGHLGVVFPEGTFPPAQQFMPFADHVLVHARGRP